MFWTFIANLAIYLTIISLSLCSMNSVASFKVVYVHIFKMNLKERRILNGNAILWDCTKIYFDTM